MSDHMDTHREQTSVPAPDVTTPDGSKCGLCAIHRWEIIERVLDRARKRSGLVAVAWQCTDCGFVIDLTTA